MQCKEYSKAKTKGTPDLELADRRVQRTRQIIEYYDPAYYFIENPAGDALRGLHTRELGDRMSEESVAAVVDLISVLTAQEDEDAE
eukprot:gene34182-biopygen18608